MEAKEDDRWRALHLAARNGHKAEQWLIAALIPQIAGDCASSRVLDKSNDCRSAPSKLRLLLAASSDAQYGRSFGVADRPGGFTEARRFSAAVDPPTRANEARHHD